MNLEQTEYYKTRDNVDEKVFFLFSIIQYL